MGRLGKLLAVGMVASTLSTSVAEAALPTVYAGDSAGYAVAFASEPAGTYALELSGTAHCFDTEPQVAVADLNFNVLTMPRLMHQARDGLAVSESGFIPFGNESLRVRASFAGEIATGAYSYEQTYEGERCATESATSQESAFEAGLYAPIGSLGGAARIGERPIYLQLGGAPVEAFLRTEAGSISGIHGSFAGNCAVGGSRRGDARRPLFPEVASAAEPADGRFRRKQTVAGHTGSGARFTEAITLAGRVEEAAIVGTYRRVRTVTREHRRPERCVTGPLPFDATRYLPAHG